jgi:hypothetical protein
MQAVGKGILRDSFNGSYLLNALRQGLSQGCGGENNDGGKNRDPSFQTHVFIPFRVRANYTQRRCGIVSLSMEWEREEWSY